jgi:hypothetical protein
VSWDAIGGLAMVVLTIAGLNAGTVKWLLDRIRRGDQQGGEKASQQDEETEWPW